MSCTVLIYYYNSNERSQPARQQPMTQTIQIPASMAGHQLVALQMPDGRQQIFALQGNQTLQMIQTPAGLQQVNWSSLTDFKKSHWIYIGVMRIDLFVILV